MIFPRLATGRFAAYDAFLVKVRLSIILVLFSLSCAARGQSTAPASPFDPARHMKVAEVRPGMKGYGLSVFSGSRIDRFEVEVISILRNFNPKSDVILVRCSGANLEHTGAIAGMSGSPVYLTDEQGRSRLAGAFAFGWSLTKDPLGGLQPIEYMLDTGPAGKPSVTEKPSADASGYHGSIRYIYNPLKLPSPGKSSSEVALSTRLTGSEIDPTQLQPLATPLMAGGLSPRLIEQFGPLLRSQGLVLLQAGGSSDSSTTQPVEIVPGSVLVAPLLTGDVSMTAVGTTTEVLGNRVFGFGHPFNSDGSISLPMGAGQINAVIPSLSQSFKIGSLTDIRGTLTSDVSTGVAGNLGPTPPTVPIDIHLVYTDGSIDSLYHFNAVWHPRLTPTLLTVGIAAALTGRQDLPEFHTIQYDLDLSFNESRSIKLRNIAVNAPAPLLMRSLVTPISFATENPFKSLKLEKISGTIRVTPEAHEADILSVDLVKTKFKPGETIHGLVHYRPFRLPEKTMSIELQLPRDIPDGSYSLSVSDRETFLQDEQRTSPYRFTAQNIDDVFKVIDDITSVREDAVYVRLMRQVDGVAIGHTTLPRLPGSRRQILLDSGRDEITPLMGSTVKIIKSELAMSGSSEVEIDVERSVKAEGRPGHATPTMPPARLPGGGSTHRAEPMQPMPDEPGDSP
ncbi:MAG TPA: hypothetical protein VHD56_02155 [Tepidisphaeraceae bacterium]|nr:hypothetical protein [Tepidisphaeraceae bacterium]